MAGGRHPAGGLLPPRQCPSCCTQTPAGAFTPRAAPWNAAVSRRRCGGASGARTTPSARARALRHGACCSAAGVGRKARPSRAAELLSADRASGGAHPLWRRARHGRPRRARDVSLAHARAAVDMFSLSFKCCGFRTACLAMSRRARALPMRLRGCTHVALRRAPWRHRRRP